MAIIHLNLNIDFFVQSQSSDWQALTSRQTKTKKPLKLSGLFKIQKKIKLT